MGQCGMRGCDEKEIVTVVWHEEADPLIVCG